MDEERARHLLSDTVYVLRTALGQDALIASGNDRLCPDMVRSSLPSSRSFGRLIAGCGGIGWVIKVRLRRAAVAAGLAEARSSRGPAPIPMFMIRAFITMRGWAVPT